MGSRSLNLYIGVTGRLRFRVWQHKRGEIDGFTKKYKCDRLLYFEEWVYFDRAEHRESQVKAWRREKKIALIKTMNPTFQDLAEHWYDEVAEELQIPRRSAPRNDKSKGGNHEELQIPRRSAPRNDNAKSGNGLKKKSVARGKS